MVLTSLRPIAHRMACWAGVWVGLLGIGGLLAESPVTLSGHPLDPVSVASRKLPPAPKDPHAYAEWCNAQLYLRKARFYREHRDTLFFAETGIARELAHFEDALSRLTSPPPIETPLGLREEGYYADNDNSFQPFLRYVPYEKPRRPGRPLIVFLHGYSPALNLINWASLPYSLMAFAQAEDWLVAAPFGRGNTDFQGIGEQDVLRVVEEMARRHGADTNRVVLTGHSMGAMGVWTIGAHYPDRFAGLLPVAGRGDFYFWKKRPPEEWPEWQRVLIDADFGGSLVENLARIPIFCVHSSDDNTVPVEEARFMVEKVRRVNPAIIYREKPEGGHLIFEETLADPDVRQWLRSLTTTAPLPPRYQAWHPRYARPGAHLPAGLPRGPVKAAFLDPFVFILAGVPPSAETRTRFQRAVQDWIRYAHATPRLRAESAGDPPSKIRHWNLFLFGEPEESPWIRRVLDNSPVRVEPEHFVVGHRRFTRSGHGLYLVRPSPWNHQRFAIIQCGLPWGGPIADNHKYDFLPDYIVYSSEPGFEGMNQPLAAGFFNSDWKLPCDPF